MFHDDAPVMLERDRIPRGWSDRWLARWTDIPITDPEVELPMSRIVHTRSGQRVELIRGFGPTRVLFQRGEVLHRIKDWCRDGEAGRGGSLEFGDRLVTLSLPGMHLRQSKGS